MLVRVVENADPSITYRYLIVKDGVTAEEVQSKIYEIKNDENFLNENPDWTVDDVLDRLPCEWVCTKIAYDEVVEI